MVYAIHKTTRLKELLERGGGYGQKKDWMSSRRLSAENGRKSSSMYGTDCISVHKGHLTLDSLFSSFFPRDCTCDGVASQSHYSVISV